jgi:hypothetical protein
MDERFEKRVNEVVGIYEDAITHFASRTWQMLERYGKVEALSRLVVSPDLQNGFKVLRDKGMLKDTFEQVVVDFREKFRPDVVQAAEWRIKEAENLLDNAKGV